MWENRSLAVGGLFIKNISEYTTLDSKSGKPYRENSRSTAPGWSKTNNTDWSTPSNGIYKTQPDLGLETPDLPLKDTVSASEGLQMLSVVLVVVAIDVADAAFLCAVFPDLFPVSCVF